MKPTNNSDPLPASSIRRRGASEPSEDPEPELVETIDNTNPGPDLAESRKAIYGHPLDRFPVASQMYEAWRNSRIQRLVEGSSPTLPEALEQSLDHVVRMVIDKLSRAAVDPLRKDNFADIIGYARTFEMCRERSEAIEEQEKLNEWRAAQQNEPPTEPPGLF